MRDKVIENFSVYMVGVGGQGIGMMSEILIRTVNYSNQHCIGVDTHGLAQRGGVVSSYLKIGKVNTPLVTPGEVDLALALERNEAPRALSFLKKGATLVYYDTSWQPLPVRLGKEKEIQYHEIEEMAEQINVKVFRVKYDLPDTRMQNVAVLATVAKYNLIPGTSTDDYLKAMNDLMDENLYTINAGFFLKIINS